MQTVNVSVKGLVQIVQFQNGSPSLVLNVAAT